MTVPKWLVYVLTSGGNVELLTMALPCLSDVAQQYTEQQKKSSKTQAPLPKLSFFYEGSTVSSKAMSASILVSNVECINLFMPPWISIFFVI